MELTSLKFFTMSLLLLLSISSCNRTDQSNQLTENDANEFAENSARFTESNGWSEIHSFELPASGIVILETNNKKLKAEISCTNRGENPYGPMGKIIGNKFLMMFSGEGKTEDGYSFFISGQRQVSETEESGRIQIDMESAPGIYQISVANAENNPLPVLHINPSGEFTFSGELKPLHRSIHAQALTGPATLSGRCQSGWPDDQFENRD